MLMPITMSELTALNNSNSESMFGSMCAAILSTRGGTHPPYWIVQRDAARRQASKKFGW